MRLSTKHANQQTISFSDFSGGLNTTDAVEMLAQNELARAVNVEIYKGQLKTVAGTKTVYSDEGKAFNYIIYDAIESKILVTDTAHNVYLLEDGTLTLKGQLTGVSSVVYAAWEDGVLIASGGRMQYYHGGTLETISNSFSDDIAKWTETTLQTWAASTAYTAGSLVTYDSKYYVCSLEHTSGTEFKADNWNEVTISVWAFNTTYTKNVSVVKADDKYYVANITHTSITDAPSACRGVFVKEGRVWTYYGDELHASAVGDETSWTSDSNDSSSAQWLQIGYKDGGSIVGVCSLSSDTLIFKDNHHAYHLAGSFPDWTVSEIGRQVDCKGFNCCVALGNSTVVLGKTKVQNVAVTDTYGDMMATDISAKVVSNITNLPSDVRMRYIPQLNQVWLMQRDTAFLFLDVNTGGWFERRYATSAVDAVEADEQVYVLKEHSVAILDSANMTDEGIALRWQFQPKTLMSNNAYLIKRIRVDTTPIHLNYADGTFTVGHVKAGLAQPPTAYCIYHDYTGIYRSRRLIYNEKHTALYTNSDEVYDNPEYIYHSTVQLKSVDMFRSDVRCVDRERGVKVLGRGAGGMTIFNAIGFDIAEV